VAAAYSAASVLIKQQRAQVRMARASQAWQQPVWLIQIQAYDL